MIKRKRRKSQDAPSPSGLSAAGDTPDRQPPQDGPPETEPEENRGPAVFVDSAASLDSADIADSADAAEISGTTDIVDSGDAARPPSRAGGGMGGASRLLLIFLETAGVLAGLFFICVCLFLWRLSSGPLDVGFAREYIEQALHDPVSGYNVRLGGVVLEWPDLHSPLTLRLRRASLIGSDQRVLGVDEVAIGVSGPGLLTGRVLPITITLGRPSLRLIRAADGRVSLSLTGTPEDESSESPAASLRIREALEQIDGRINPRSPLARLRGIEVGDASLIFEDHVLGMSWYLPNFNIRLLRDEAGIVMTSGLELPSAAGVPSQIQLNAVYSSRNQGAIHAHLTLDNFDPRIVSRKIPSLSWLTPQVMSLSGGLDVMLDRDMNLAGASLSLVAAEGALSWEGVYDTPLPFRDLELDMSYDAARRALRVPKLSLTLKDTALRASAEAEIGENSIQMPLRLSVPDLPQEKIGALWPENLRGESVEEWLVHKLSGGRIADIALGLTLALERESPAADWTADARDIHASFDISGMDVDYRAPLTPARGVTAKGRFAGDVLEIDIAGGAIGGMDVRKGKVTIDHIVEPGPGMARIAVDLAGPLPEVFAYIAAEPIEMTGDRLGLNADAVKGMAALGVNVAFPTIRDLLAEQVEVSVDGTLTDVTLPDAVKDLPLTGGPFALTVGDGQVVLKGAEGRLDGRPVTFEWQQYLESEGKPYSSRITADMTTDDALRDRLGLGIEDWVAGRLPVKVVYTQMRGGRATIDVQADVTPAILMVKPFAFEKPPGVPGTAQATVTMQDGYLREVRDLTVRSRDVTVTGARLVFETVQGESVLRRGEIPAAILGESDAALDFTIEAGGLMSFDVRGRFVDARPFLDDEHKRKKEPRQPGTAGPPIHVSMNADGMRTHKEQTIGKVSLDLALDRHGLIDRMDMSATAGNGPIFLRIAPDDAGRLSLRFEAADAGATLRAFGVYENVRGGTLLVEGRSTDPARPRVIAGHAGLSDFRVINAPALARLISAISPTGLPQLLGGDGLGFARLQSRFEWHMRAAGDVYTISDGRTSGSSLGLTFAGIINKERNIIDIDGHVVPMSEVNNLISNIPLVGSILTGGNGALFAATYTLRGPLGAPDVSVNPLSVLAPGILRRILFESGD